MAGGGCVTLSADLVARSMPRRPPEDARRRYSHITPATPTDHSYDEYQCQC